ncbi:glycosyltransferase [Aliihoeflea sp. 40Bstr573]|uniref:glycosyltransferase n=1 Tax=Aliihoeflea sp. 40Bstr573 TaxID=2696467 RepID=UPI0020964241|nr:glycosyltransferase [Aliihoeflea sp. 40Bstr573]MCO6387496.1 glycosyltransferase [Aliihoeflea sp. 40Bstr573]
MRVLHVFKTYWPETYGGIERAINSIAEGTADLGASSTVFTLASHTADLPETLGRQRIVRAKRTFEVASTGLSLNAIGGFRQSVAEADLVHYHFPWPFMDVLHFAGRVRKPAVLSYHSDIVKQRRMLQVYRPLMNRFLSRMDAIVATSPDYAATSPTLSAFINQLHIIPLGLERRDHPPAAPELLASWRQRFPRPFFLFTGVFRYYKGLHILIEAAKAVDADIVLVGAGPEEGALRAQALGLGAANVHFVGAVEDADKNALLELCRGFVFPSHLRSEAYGLSLVEAAMMGKPMISCEIGSGMSFINRDGETGIVVPPRDPRALGAAMRVLVEDPAESRRMGEAAQERYREQFTAKRMAASYFALYQDVLSRGKSRRP